MTQVIKVTKAGKDVLTATDPNDFIFSSDFYKFKIISEGNLTSQSITGDPTTITQAHGQSYIPAIMAFAKFPDGLTTLPNSLQKSTWDDGARYFIAEVDGTNMYFMFYKDGTANYSVDIKYYIFESPAT